MAYGLWTQTLPLCPSVSLPPYQALMVLLHLCPRLPQPTVFTGRELAQAASPPSTRQGWRVLGQSQLPGIQGWGRWVSSEAPGPLQLSCQWLGTRSEWGLGFSWLLLRNESRIGCPFCCHVTQSLGPRAGLKPAQPPP